MMATIERPTIDSEDYSAEKIAQWLFRNSIPFRTWFSTQYAIISVYLIDGEHRRADFFHNRAKEISDHLRALGAVHLLH